MSDFSQQDFAANDVRFFRQPGRGLNFVFAASSSQQAQTETQQTNSTAGASSPSIGLTGSQNASVNTGTRVSLGNNSAIQTFDPQVADSAFSAIVTTVQNALNAVTGTVSQATQTTASQTTAQNQLLSAVLAQDQATAANVASGGQTNNNTTLVEIAIAGVAAFVIWMIWGKR